MYSVAKLIYFRQPLKWVGHLCNSFVSKW